MYLLVDKNVMTKGSQEPKPLYPLGIMVQYSLIQGFKMTLQNITITNNENRLYVERKRKTTAA